MSTKEIAGDERTRTITWQDPLACAEEAGNMNGLDYLLALQKREAILPPICGLIDFQITQVERGHVVFEITPAEYHYNPFGAVHGGIASTVLDSAMACAVHSMLPRGIAYTTIEIKTNFVRPITVESGRMKCEGRVIHAGNRVATADARMTDKDGRLCAHGVSTCLIFQTDAV